ncbi:MAG: trypsin-like peptidase domain-containing protein [Nitrosomonadales bacterium]|nr:trypsin-like peptidase domain-containing protein [Nitrosomonadales bacterium]
MFTAYSKISYFLAMIKKLILFSIIFPITCFSMPGTEVLFNANRSVVKVHVINDKGNYGVGSGVVVAKNYVVTNCHVIANSQGIHVTKYGVSYPPYVLIADWKSDLCILKFKFLELKPVTMINAADVEYELDVFAKGYRGNAARPGSSFGTVKAKFDYDGNQIIQSSAPFSLGASGGGLFNYDGELLGITTFKTPGRPAFYYSMPVEIIKEMLANGKEISDTTAPERAFWDRSEDNQPYFMRVVSALNKKDWSKLMIISEDWVKDEPNADESNFHLGLANYHLNKEGKAYKLFKKVVSQNKKHTQSYFYLYKIAKAKNNNNEMIEYKKKIEQLDSNLNMEMNE